MNTITTSDVCILAADKYGYNFHTAKILSPRKDGNNDENNSNPDGCFVQSWIKLPFSLPENVNSWNDILMINKNNSCDSDDLKCQCTPSKPCFCMTHFYVDRRHIKPQRKMARANGQFVVTWDLDLGGQDDLLESPFLRASFGQSVKDYINNDIRCSGDIHAKGAEFFGVTIPVPEDLDERGGKRRAVSGNGKCKGDVFKCKKGLKNKKGKSLEGRSLIRKTTDCVEFNKTTIFDSFSERLLTAASYDYRVDVDTVIELVKDLNLE